jgi:hypothetical protein
LTSVCGSSDHGKHAVVILSRGSAEISVELARTELGRCVQRVHIVRARCSHRDNPTGIDLNALGQDAEVGMGLGGLVAVWDDLDVGPEGDGPELAFVAAVVASCRAIAAQSLSFSLLAGPISLRVARRPMGSAPPAKTLASSFFPRRTKRSGSSRPLRFKKAARSGAPRSLRPVPGSKAFRFP